MIDSKDEDRRIVEEEFTRMGFDKDSLWRISDINEDFELCNTYPRFLILPADFRDEDIDSVAKFRYFRRIPTAVWRHTKNGCFIVRSSQPTVGWFGWFRNDMDENLVQSYVNITMQQTRTNGSSCGEPIDDINGSHEEQNNGDASTLKATGDENDKEEHKERVLDDNHDRCGNCCDRIKETNGDGGIQNDHGDFDSKPGTTANNSNGFESRHVDSADSARIPDGDCQTEHSHNQNHSDLNTKNHESDHATRGNTDEPDFSTSNNNVDDDSILASELSRGVSVTELKQSPFPMASLNGNGTTNAITVADPNSPKQETQPTNISDIQNQTSTTTTDSVTAEPTTTAISSSKMLIIDARSYAAAMANRAKGGGCECSEYYQKCEVHFMNLANIHSIRRSYHAIRGVCEAYSEQSNNWVSFLDNSRWLHHISGLIKSSLLVVDAIDIEEKSIMIHCSDGWDRTPQLVALAEIMLDPRYRTFEGFRILIQREWLDFGHKFADRCGSNPCNEDPNERCPVFLQWLDCVQQLLVQYPKHFEFNSAYLDKLNRHTFSNVFGTFSYNSAQERILSKVDDKLFSLWSYFESAKSKYRNENYVASDEVLRPSFKVKDLHFWKEVYLPPINQPRSTQASFIPITNNIDNNKCSQDSLFIDGPATGTVCK